MTPSCSPLPRRLTASASFTSASASAPAPAFASSFLPSPDMMQAARSNRKLRLLVAATGPRDTSWAQALVVRFSKNPEIEMRAIVDDVVPRLAQTIIVMQNFSLTPGQGDRADDAEFYRQQAYDLVEWADLLVCVPLDADGIAKMLAGMADTFLGEVLRGWDSQKVIVLVPGMSTHMWANPMTKRQLGKIRRKWGWVRALTPILWHYEGSPNPKRVPHWNGFNDVLGIIKNQADLLGLGRDVDIVTTTMAAGMSGTSSLSSSAGAAEAKDAGGGGGGGARARARINKIKLPPEIWTIIFDLSGDWELAKAMGIYTTLPMPAPWTLQPKDASNALQVYEHELEWTALTGNAASVCRKLSEAPTNFQDLPTLVVKMMIRFGLTEVLGYLEANRPDLFRAFEGTVLSTKASAYYARTEVLDFWRQSKYFRNKHAYDAEAIDGASKNGYVRVLDWWWQMSGLPMRYTESALEEASAKGHLHVLEWWRDAAAQDESIVLRPGRSLLFATLSGRAEVLRWWEASGIPLGHGEGIPKVASRWGQVECLELWRKMKGDDKLVFDEEVLVAATMHQHLGILEWWRRYAHGELPGMDGPVQKVEFRTCNIEEALEDTYGDQSKVRQWWVQNGLNLGLRNEEWLQARCL